MKHTGGDIEKVLKEIFGDPSIFIIQYYWADVERNMVKWLEEHKLAFRDAGINNFICRFDIVIGMKVRGVDDTLKKHIINIVSDIRSNYKYEDPIVGRYSNKFRLVPAIVRTLVPKYTLINTFHIMRKYPKQPDHVFPPVLSRNTLLNAYIAKINRNW